MRYLSKFSGMALASVRDDWRRRVGAGFSPLPRKRHEARLSHGIGQAWLARLAADLFVLGVAALPLPAAAEPTASELADMKALYQRPKAVPYPKGNEYSVAKENLGRQLFFDPRLSGPGNMSCATCHSPTLAWGDGLRTGVGSGGNSLDRRTPTLLNAAWLQISFWDGRADTLEEQAVGPIQNSDEMNMTMPRLTSMLRDVPGYRAAFAAAFPGEQISTTTIGKAIATIERTIVSGTAPFDRWIAGDEGAIDPAAKRGFVAFNTTGHCSACHSTWRFTDDSFHDIGLHDNDLAACRTSAHPASVRESQ